jgi:hypothetical protein
VPSKMVWIVEIVAVSSLKLNKHDSFVVRTVPAV